MTAPVATSGLVEGPRSPVDLRLVPGFGTSWLAAAWATAAGAAASAVAAGCCAILGVAVLVLLGWGRRRARGSAAWRGRSGRAAGVLPVAVLALAAVAVVLASAGAQLTVRSRPPLPAWISGRAVVEASGRIVTDPHRVASTGPVGSSGAPRFTVRVQLHRISARGRTVSADVPVLVIGGPAWGDLTAGGHLALTARLEATEPGDDAVALARALGPPRVAPGGPVWRLADRLRSGLRAACAGLPEDAGGLLPSLVVGDTGRLPDRLRTDLQTAGLTHLTAVSGANVAIVAGAVLWLGTRLGVRRSVRLAVAVAIVAGFVVVARPQPSVLRAAAMGVVALLGLGMSRRPRGVPVLAAAGTILLVADPWLARSAGFALSCVATAALLLLAPGWTRRLSRRMPVPVAAALAVPAAAQAACGPVVVLLSPSVSLVAVPANLIAEPAVAPATVAGVLAAVVAPVWPAAAHVLAWAGSVATGWIARVAHVGAGLPLATVPWPGGPAGALLLAGLTVVLVVVSLAPSSSRPEPTPEGAPYRRGDPAWAARLLSLVVVLALASLVGWLLGSRGVLRWPGPWPGGGGPPPGWAVVQCDVGQGAATVLRSGPDRAVLLDTGPLPSTMDRCLRRLGVRHLDLVLLTHHHADHVQGLPGALRHRDARAIVVSPLAEPAAQANDVQRLAAGAGVPVAVGWAGVTGAAGAGPWSVRWRLLAPVERPASQPPGEDGDGTAVNESSLVTAADVTGPAGILRVISLGDLESEGQQRLRERLTTGRVDVGGPVDVLVVAHHGSARQDPRLCPLLAPRVALVGVGEGNDYGHPAPSALAMVRACGAVLYRTDLAGNIALVPGPAGRLTVVADRSSKRSASGPVTGHRSSAYSHTVVPMSMPLPEARLQLDALMDLVREVSSQRNVGDVLDVALRQCLHLTASEFGFIGLVNRPTADRPVTALEIVAIHGFHPAPSFYARHRVIPLRPNLFGRVILQNRPVRTLDAATDPDRVGQPRGHPVVHTFLGVPLALDGTTIGMVGLANRASAYGDEHERLATTYASLIAVLVHKAQLYEQLQRTNESLERLVADRTRELAQARDELADKAGRLQEVLVDTVDAAERERRRIAGDIHDGINQLLVGAMLELTSGEHRLLAGQPAGAAEAIGRAREILAEVETEIRRVVHDLHPPILDGLGLAAALRDLAERFTVLCRVPCRVEVEGRPVRLPADTEIALYRIVQEALQNVAAHARAGQVVVRAGFDVDHARVTLGVDDDGRGFDPCRPGRRPQDGRRHLGIDSMRRRVESLAGQWQLHSGPGRGTSIVVRVPFPPGLPTEQPSLAAAGGPARAEP